MDPLFAKILYFVLLAIQLNVIHPFDAKPLLESKGYKMEVYDQTDKDGNYLHDFVVLSKTDTLYRGDSTAMVERRVITLTHYNRAKDTIP